VTAELAQLVWPIERIGEAVVALARRTGLVSTTSSAATPRQPPGDPAALDRWLAAAGDQLGVAVEAMTATYRDVDDAIAAAYPAVVRVPDGLVVVIRRRGAAVVCLGPDGEVGRTSRRALGRVLRDGPEQPQRARIDELLRGTQLSGAARARAEAGMFNEFLATTVVMRAWLLRRPPSASFAAQLGAAGLFRLAGGLAAAHAAQYGLFLLSWWAIGRALLGGYTASGWLWGWALILLGSVPLLMLSTWWQGKLTVGAGGLLRRRLLAGALELPPSALSRDGVGRLLGRVIEADALERLALTGGLQSLLALLELALVVPVLVAGAGGWFHAGLLGGWLGLTLVLWLRFAGTRRQWTEQRLALTGVTVEHIVGHRTRLAQELPERWHEAEDDALARYLARSVVLDRQAIGLMAIVPRGWLLVGLAALTPAFVGGADAGSLGAGIGGAVLAWMSLSRLAPGLDQLAAARVAWQRVAPLFRAAARRHPDASAGSPASRLAAPEYAIAQPARPGEPVLEVVDVTFRHDRSPADVLTGCDLVIRHGDRVLIQGASGSGKSTLASLLTGTQLPRSGLVLARGLDMSCLGETGWRARVAASPQFHENHILTESFAFNLLMSRTWPPRPEDLGEARAICEELGLGPLLERMPGGMFQMVGETGWQLSHGEQSRLFIARALLQRCDVVILDESLAALDPENMAAALRCVRARAPSLVVIAHP
jgi:ATP-binding cassette subfamily B protein